ncbi:MAG: helix-turn-helix transcriptional regulator [Pseudomonadota bacterium]
MREASEKLQAIRIDTRTLSPELALQTMRSVSDGTHTVFPLPSNPPKVGLNGDLWVLESLHAAKDYGTNCRIFRKSTSGPTIAVRYRIMREGRLNGVLGEQSISLKPGDLFVSSYNTPYALDLEDFSGDIISMSAASLGQERANKVGSHVLRVGDPETRIITGAIKGFFEALDDVDIATANRLATMLRGTLERHMDALAPESESSSGTARDPIGPMLQFIDEHLNHQDLGIEIILQAFPTSRAVIYRNFEKFGGVNRYIFKRRLERALSVLVFDRHDISIGQIAKDHGFRDQGHFSRAFKKHFGVTPKDARSSFSQDEMAEDVGGDLPSASGLLMRELLDRSGHV